MLCCLGELGDDYHYLFECNFFKLQRQKYLSVSFSLIPNAYQIEKTLLLSINLELHLNMGN